MSCLPDTLRHVCGWPPSSLHSPHRDRRSIPGVLYLTDSPAQQISSAIMVETTPRTLLEIQLNCFSLLRALSQRVSLLLWFAFLLLPFSLFISQHLFSSLRTGTARRGQTWRATYWPPAARIPAFKMEVAAAKMCAALWLGISFSVFSQCWM